MDLYKIVSVILIAACLFACSESVEDLQPENSMSVGELHYTMKSGFFQDYMFYENDPSPFYSELKNTHSGREFKIYNISFEDIESGNIYSETSSPNFNMLFELFSPGKEGFTLGDGVFYKNSSSEVTNSRFFAFAEYTELVKPELSDGMGDDVGIVNGKVFISDLGNDVYLLECDVELEDGRIIKGSYKGEFRFMDETN